MNLSEIAIKRPVFTVMVTAALMVLGAMGLSRLGTDLFPDVRASLRVSVAQAVFLSLWQRLHAFGISMRRFPSA